VCYPWLSRNTLYLQQYVWSILSRKKDELLILGPQHLLQVLYCSSIEVEWACSISRQWCKAGWKQPASSTVKLLALFTWLHRQWYGHYSAYCCLPNLCLFAMWGSFVLSILSIQITLETQPRGRCYNYIPSDITIGHIAVFLSII
jgi:hypothetical protein